MIDEDEPDVYLMPFGKFAGWPLAEIRSSYLVWVIANVDLRPWLDAAVRSELYARGIDMPEDEAA